MEPLVLSELSFELDAGGRLVHVRRTDGGPPLVGHAEDRPFGFALTLSRLADGWRVVR